MSSAIFSSPRAEARIARASDWLARVGRDRETLIVGATALAARTLVRQITAVGGATFGWRPSTLGGLALSLATPKLVDDGFAAAGVAIVQGLTVRALHRLGEEGGLGRLAVVADRPGLARAVADTVFDLRMAGVKPEQLGKRSPELAGILTAFEALLQTEKLADRAAIFEIAAEESALRRSGLPLLLLDVPIWTALEARLIAGVASTSPETLATVPAGDERSLERLRSHLANAETTAGTTTAPGGLGRLQASLFSQAVITPSERGEDVVFMSAPGESRECVEIARRILREAEAGTPFDRMAILLRSPSQYRAHLQEALRRARIPVNFSSGAVQPDPAGRAFLALLTCLEEGLSARRFAEYLSLGESPDATPRNEPPPAAPATDRWVPADEELFPATLADEAPADSATEAGGAGAVGGAVLAGTLRTPRRWEQILVDSAVIGGRNRWERRLGGWHEELVMRLGELDADDPRGEGTKRDLVHLEALRSFAPPILDALQALPSAAPWGAWLEQLSALATRTLRRPDRVLSVLAELAPMAPVGPVALAEVQLVLARRLANLVLAPSSRSAGHVFVGPVATARGLAFDVVFVPGLAERMFPQRVNQDPLLRDEHRKALSKELGTIADRVEGERLALRIAIGCANRKVVLSYPRVDAEQARPRVPSFYGLEVLRAVEGQLPSFDVLARNADRGSATRLGWPAPEDPTDAIDEAEHDLSLLDKLVRPGSAVMGAARYLITSNPHLARALRHRAMRFDPARWSFADGLVKPDEAARAALAAHALANRSYSATAMQSFAACPYRFLLYAVHKLAPREEPVAIEKIEPLDKGSLVHEVLFELLSELRDRGMAPLREANFAQAREILERLLAEVATRYKDKLAPAIERVWEDGIAAIRSDLLESLRRECERPPWKPWKLELAFGLPTSRGRDPSSNDRAVALDCGITLRGSIDVVDEGPDGSLRATDHKTGKPRQRAGDVVAGGESLQPVFYALALEKLFPERQVSGGRLSYCTSAGDFKEVLVPLDRRARAAADSVAKAVGDALTGGFLPAAPKKDACRFCDYRPVCGPWEEERTAKKRDRAPLAALEALRRLP